MKSIGNVGEAKVLAKLVEMQVPVYMQFGDNERADYLIIVDNKCLKCQVKTSTVSDDTKTIFSLRRVHDGKKESVYSTDEVDAFLLYDLQKDNVFVLKNTGDNRTVTIRYQNAKNNIHKGVHMCDEMLLTQNTLHNIAEKI